jgi:membrane protease YdiL (CAAX protease family)
MAEPINAKAQSLPDMKVSYFILRLLPYFFVGIGCHVFRNAWFALVGYHLGIIAVLGSGRQFQAVKLQPGAQGLSLLAALLGLSAGLLLLLLWPLLEISPGIKASLITLGLDAKMWPFFIAYFAFANPFLEEIYWRGYLGNPSPRLVPDDLWFALYHLLVTAAYANFMIQMLALCGLVFAAWMWRQLVNRSGSLLASIISHMLADFSILSAVYLRMMR